MLPCGSGKSRITATIALLLLATSKAIKRVHIVYVNDVLKKKDEEDFKDLWAVMPHGDRVQYHSDLDFTSGSNSVVLVDENDEYMFKNPTAFVRFARKSICICLTATPADDATGGLERSVLKAMGFKIFENLVDGVKLDVVNPMFERISCSSEDMLIGFIEQEIRK